MASAVVATSIFVVAYALIATERVHRVAAALGGAGLMLAFGFTDAHAAFFSEQTGIDWNVVFLLLGMMVIVGVLRQTGVFEFLAIWSAKRAGGKPFRIMVVLGLITAVASALLDNVTTVLLIAPVTILVCERLGLNPVPYLISEAIASNIGGAATLIGDPPNIIIASRSGLSFNDFLAHMAPIALILLLVWVVLVRVLFRRFYVYDAERVAEIMSLSEREAIRDPRLLGQGLAVLAVVTLGFVLHTTLHLEPSVVALLGAGLLVAITRLSAEKAAEEVEWPTLVFFMGLFVMVGALVETGVIEALADGAVEFTEGRLAFATLFLLWVSAALSAIVDNIPYVATMSPIVDQLVQGAAPGEDRSVLWWALALGADLGGNATAIGASANVVVLGTAARSGYRISFWEFTKYGLVVAVVTVALCMPYLWFRYLAFT